jgi:hypothetical protein
MKVFALVPLIVPFVGALPFAQMGGGTIVPISDNLQATLAKLRDKNGKLDGGLGPKVRDDLIGGKCGSIVFIFARASLEPGNMVLIPNSIAISRFPLPDDLA